MPKLRSSSYVTGVYLIRNKRNRKVYVGSASKSFKSRWEGHRNQLIGRRHFNKHLQAAWDIYGGDAFEFVILEKCLPERCVEREQHWIDWYKAANPEYGYNSRPRVESNLGHKFGPQTNPEVRAKRSASLKVAWKTVRKGFRHSTLTQIKIHKQQRGRKRSAEFRAKVSAGLVGRPVSEKTRAKMSASAKKRGVSPETIEKMIASKRSEESRKKASESAKRRGISEEQREKMIEARRAKHGY